jgi:hypothetical protein
MNEKQFLALPEDQRKALQQRLIDQGVYVGKTDGRYGAGTRAAFDELAKREAEGAKASQAAEERKRQDDLRGQEIEVERLKAQGGKATADAGAAKLVAETERRQRYNDQAASPAGLATQSASNLVAPAAGTALGMALGKGVNVAMDASQESRNKVLQGVAADRVAGLTTKDGAREGARLAGAMPMGNAAARTTARMLPHLGLGAISMGKGAQVLHDNDPESEFYTQMANRGAGLGYIGVGAGLAKQGLRYGNSPGVVPDARSIAIINSNQLRRGGLAEALGDTAALPAASVPAEPKALTPGTKAHMIETAKSLGIKGTSNMTKSDLAQALAKSVTENGAKRVRAKALPKLPGGTGAAAIAGGLAYALTPEEAQAADGTTRGGNAEALTNAGVAGGVGYGTSKLAEALGGSVGRAGLSMVGDASAPGLIDAMTDPTQDEMNTAANWQIRNLPRSMLSQSVGQTADMGQLPSPGDRDDASMLARAQDEQAQRMPMNEAANLQIPEGIPAPQADGANPYGEPIMRRLQRMQATGATPEQISSFLNQAVR